jgi:hypothetical protein
MRLLLGLDTFLNFHTSLVLPLGTRLIFGWYEAGIYQCWAGMSTLTYQLPYKVLNCLR